MLYLTEVAAVLSPFWSVDDASTVPAPGLQLVMNRPLAPPLSDSAKLVSGMSGRPLKDVVSVARLTEPVRVSGNGDGKTSVSDGPSAVPVKYALAVSGFG